MVRSRGVVHGFRAASGMPLDQPVPPGCNYATPLGRSLSGVLFLLVILNTALLPRANGLEPSPGGENVSLNISLVSKRIIAGAQCEIRVVLRNRSKMDLTIVIDRYAPTAFFKIAAEYKAGGAVPLTGFGSNTHPRSMFRRSSMSALELPSQGTITINIMLSQLVDLSWPDGYIVRIERREIYDSNRKEVTAKGQIEFEVLPPEPTSPNRPEPKEEGSSKDR